MEIDIAEYNSLLQLSKPLKRSLGIPSETWSFPVEVFKKFTAHRNKDFTESDVRTFLKVVPIRLHAKEKQRDELFLSLQQHCLSKEYNGYGDGWPIEVDDSLGLDSLLDWDFDIEEQDNKQDVIQTYSNNQLIVVTSRTIHINNKSEKYSFPHEIVDVISIPNRQSIEANDTCLVCLKSGDIYSMYFEYKADMESFDISCPCIWKVKYPAPNFRGRFIYSRKSDSIGLVTSMNLTSIIKLHRRHRTFFRIEFNVLLRPNSLFESVTWQDSSLIYLTKINNSWYSMEKVIDGSRDTVIHCEIPAVEDDKPILLDKDTVLNTNDERKTCNIYSGGDYVHLKYNKITFVCELTEIYLRLFSTIKESIKMCQLLVIELHAVIFCFMTETNKILIAPLTRFALEVNDIAVDITTDNRLCIYVNSRGVLLKYIFDVSNLITYQIEKEWSWHHILLLDKVLSEEFFFEGYQEIINVYDYHETYFLQSKDKLYELDAINPQSKKAEEITWIPEFKVFQDFKVINLHSSWTNTKEFGPITIDQSISHSHQYIILGLSNVCQNEAYYLEIKNNIVQKFQVLDDLLPYLSNDLES